MRYCFDTNLGQTVLILVVGTLLAAVTHEYVEHYTRMISRDVDRGIDRMERMNNTTGDWAWAFLTGFYYLFLAWIPLMLDVAVFTFYRFPAMTLRWYLQPGMFHRPRCMAFLYTIPLRYDNATQIDRQRLDALCGLKEGDSPVTVFADMARVYICITMVVFIVLAKIYSVHPVYKNPIYWAMLVWEVSFVALICETVFLLAEYEEIHGMCMNG